jgi:hypothetical protein
MVAATSWLVARRLGPQPLTGFVLAAYLVGFTEVIAITLALSIVHALTRWTLFAGVAGVFAIALGPWLRRAAPTPSLRDGVATLRDALREPILAVLAVAVAVGLVYSAALATLTPPNDWDAMTYHLARAAFWIQQQAVAYVPDTLVLRINVNPPNAEVGTVFTMLLSGGDRYVGLVQYTAMLATAVAVYGIAGRTGLERRAALFGALVFLTLPLVALQGSTALNDIVVASFLVTATYFLLGEAKVELALGGLALALAIGTKFTALIALPLVALVVLLGQPRRRWPAVALGAVAGVGLGSYWLIVNLAETGSLDGHAGEVLGQDTDRRLEAILARTTRLMVNFADSMDLGRDRLVYAIAGAALLVIAIAVDRVPTRRPRLSRVALVGFACLPIAIPVVHQTLLKAHEKLWLTLGEHDLAFLDEHRDSWPASTVFSYYGPLGFILLLVGFVLAVRSARRHVVRPFTVLLAAAPLVFAVLVAVALPYDPWRGRFFMFSVALAAPTWGLALRHRWLAWGASAIAAATLLLAFVHSVEKPAGIRLLEGGTSNGVWGRSRETVQMWTRGGGTADVVEFFALKPRTGRVGLRFEENDWVYPYFGSGLDHEVVFLPTGASFDGLDWIVLGSGRPEQPGPGWETALETEDGWRVLRRTTAG